MEEISLNILDIAQNSIRAQASMIEIEINEDDEKTVVKISDDGIGMDQKLLCEVTDPFKTTKPGRKAGLGIPLFKMDAEMTGGDFSITSKPQHGTTVCASFLKRSLDMRPLGDITETICTLINSADSIDILFTHNIKGREIRLSTKEMREKLCEVPLSDPYVISWTREYLDERYKEAFLHIDE